MTVFKGLQSQLCQILSMPCNMETVKFLIFWCDGIKSAIVFWFGLLVLLSLATWSFIPLAGYTALIALAISNALRLYRSMVLQDTEKAAEQRPAPALTEAQLEKFVRAALPHLNALLCRVHHLYIYADHVTTLTYAIVLWLITCFGLFSPATFLLVGFIFIFTVPKLYVDYHPYLDRPLALIQVNTGRLYEVYYEQFGGKQAITGTTQEESEL